MTQAAALGSQLPPSLAFFGYAFALAAGRATMNVNEQVVLAIAAQLKDAGTAALEEKVAAEEEKLAQGCAPRLSPDELHLIVVQAPAVAKVMEAIEISDATRTEMAASVNDSFAPALSLTRLGNREAHTMAVEERIQKRHDAAKAVAEKVQRRHEALNYLEHFYGDNSIPRAQIDGAGDLVISGSASALDAPTPFSHPQAEDIDDANKYQPTFLGGKDKARRASATEKRIKDRHEAAHHLPGIHPPGNKVEMLLESGRRENEEGWVAAPLRKDSKDAPFSTNDSCSKEPQQQDQIDTVDSEYHPTLLGEKDSARRASAAEKRIKKRHEAAHHLPGLHPAK